MLLSKEKRPMRTFVRAAGAVVCLMALVLFASTPLSAQGVTTGAVRGRLLDDAGTPVVGASILLTNTSNGQRYQTVSRAGGLYNLEYVGVGGPYRLEARAIGYQPARQTDLTVPLGQALTINLELKRAAVQLEAIVVPGTVNDAIFAPTRQGTETTISDTALVRLPTLDREFTDFVRLTPQVSVRDDGGLAVVSQNNRFNTVLVDGSTVNDRFGLGSTGLAGGQAAGRVVGLEAVKEYQVLLAPYDVRQGDFTGALVNAVTKSGTNTFHGSAFWYFRNQSLAGDPLGLTDFKQHQFGASFGGPIVRDKAQFFLNAEFRRRTDPASGPYIGQPDPIRVTQADVDAVNAALTSYNLPTGSAGVVENKNPLANLLARVDYQVGSRSRLVLRYLYNTADDDIFSRSNSGTFALSNNGYAFKNRTNNPSVEFYTNFANGMSNEFRASLNRIRDRRTPTVTAPLVTINGFNDPTGGPTFGIRVGSEQFSQGNELDQDIWEFTDNLTLPIGDHRITVGTRNEVYKVRNLFAQSSYGVWTFNTLADFQAGTASEYDVAGDIGGQGIAARFTSGIFAGYVQDQWQATPALAVTYGLRADIPTFFDQPAYDPRVAADGFNTKVPSGQLMLSPRLGFNYDLHRQTQIRGGAGVFTGTPAYVWLANAYANNGTKLGRITCLGSNAPAFTAANFNPADPILQCTDGTGIVAGTTIGEVDIIGPDTRFPQVFRANFAVDHRLPGGLVGTAEFIFTKGLNDYFIVNRNLDEAAATTDAQGRVVYGTTNANGTVSPNYVDLTLYGPSFNGGVFELLNTSNNYSWNATLQLQKRFSHNWEANVGYTYSKGQEVASFTSSRAISNWQFGRVYSGSQLDDNATTSSFSRPNRIVVSGTYTFPWRYQTDISLSYVGQSGQPYTLIAGGASGRGDLNADGSNVNDPIYIPMDATTEMLFQDIPNGASAAEQATAFNQYIAGESCLVKQRGSIMERNSCRNPWQNFFNLSLRQTLPRFGGNSLTLEVGVFNLLNLLNSDWGQVKSVDGTVFFTDAVLTMVDADDTTRQPIFQFDPGKVAGRFEKISTPTNSYQIQVGLRYAF
jgi:hypothetical protein